MQSFILASFRLNCCSSCTADALLGFPLQVVKLLYDDDIIEEDAVLVWADEKQMAEEDERKYLKKAAAFIAWLREAESEEETSSVDSD